MKFNLVIRKIQAFSLLLIGSGIVLVTQAQMKDSSTNGSHIYSPSSSLSKVAERSSEKDPLNMQTPKPTKYLRKGDKIVSSSGIPATVMKKKVVIYMKGNNSTVAPGKNGNVATIIEGTSKAGGVGYYKVKGAKINLSKQSDDLSIISKKDESRSKNNTEITSSLSLANTYQGEGKDSKEKRDTLPPSLKKHGNDYNLTKSKHSPAPSKASKNAMKKMERSSENNENNTVSLVVPQLKYVANDTTNIESPSLKKGYASEKGPLLETKPTFQPTYDKKTKDATTTASIRSPAPSKQLKNSLTSLQRDYKTSENTSIALHIPQPNALAIETQVITSPSPSKAYLAKEDVVVEAGSTIAPSSEKKSKDTFSKYTPSPSKQLTGDTLQRDSGSNGNEIDSLKISQPKALADNTTLTTSPSPAKASFGKKSTATKAWSSTQPSSEKSTPAPSKDSKMNWDTLERDSGNFENGTISLRIPSTAALKNDMASTVSPSPPNDAQVLNSNSETDVKTMAQPKGLHNAALPTLSPSLAAAPLKEKGDSGPSLESSNLEINNRTIPPSFPQPATVEDFSSVTALPISPAILKNKKEGAKNASSFDETHEASTGEDPILDVSSKLTMKETLEESMLNISGSEDPFNVSEVSRLPTKTSKSYGSNVASTSSANRQKGAETNEYFSLSYHSASTVPPTTSKKTSKKVYGTNSISPTSAEVVDENYSLSYLYAPTVGPSKGEKHSVSLQPSGASSQAHPNSFKSNFTPSATPFEGKNHSASLQPSSTSPQAQPNSSGNFISTAFPTKGKIVFASSHPSGSHSEVLPTSAGNITFTYYEDITLAPLQVLSSQGKSSKYIRNETLNYLNYDNATGEGNPASEITRSSIGPNTNETFTSQISGNIDPIISVSTISSSADSKNEPASYTTPPILDTLAAMNRPQKKGSRDWKYI